MKVRLHKSSDRGLAAYGWLVSRFSFSFANYFNPERMEFGSLRVLNDDIIAPDNGFDTHHHDNMEIITIVLEGTLTHRDSLGTVGIVEPGDVQIMSAGTGIEHSEYNLDLESYLKLFQIWITPEHLALNPRYGQKNFPAADRHNKLQALVTPDGADGSLQIFQHAWLHRIDLDEGQDLTYNLHSEKHGLFILNIDGQITAAGETLNNRDSIEISETTAPIHIAAKSGSQILLIEVPVVFP